MRKLFIQTDFKKTRMNNRKIMYATICKNCVSNILNKEGDTKTQIISQS